MSYVALVTAATLRFKDGTPVRSREAYLGWQAEILLDRGIATRDLSDDQTPAHVNHGRWVVSCRCGESPLTHPAWRLACCGECGWVLTNVVFPTDWPEVEALLLLRPRRDQQHWLLGETTEDLRAENAAHAV